MEEARPRKMAYLKNQAHDVFVSYAHVDNIPDREGEKGWVERFERQLSVHLLKRFGEEVEVWRDPELGRAQVFDDVIEKAVRGSGVMVSLISARYLKSDYCQQEIRWFEEKARSESVGMEVAGYRRIFPILLYNIAPDEWPQACQGTSGFRLHDGEGAAFGAPLDPDSDELRAQIRILVEEIYTVLTKISDATSANPAATGGSRAPSATPAGEGFRVFLAQPPDDQGAAKRQLAKALASEGIEVVSQLPPPYEPEPHRQAVVQALDGVDLSIHLLGQSAGEAIEEDDPACTYPLEQTRIAMEHAKSQIVVTPASLSPELIDEATYGDFLRELIEQERDAERFQLLQIDRHRMVQEILAKKQAIEDARRQEAEAATPGGTAFVDLHMNDLVYATDLVSYLGTKNFTPLMVPSADQAPTMSVFEENLRKARLFLVVFGQVARDWVQHRLIEASKLILVNGLTTKIGVYVAPPGKPAQEVAFPYDVAVNTNSFDPSTLDPILEKVDAALA